MTTLRQFQLDDLLRFNHINLDVLTETYNGSFYMAYMSQWPESFVVAEAPYSLSCYNSMNRVVRKENSSSNKNDSTSNSVKNGNFDKNNNNCNNNINDNPTLLQTKQQKEAHSLSIYSQPPPPMLMGYLLGKAEGEGKLWHGHVSAVTVAPSYRRLGLAQTLMKYFESDICIDVYGAYFVDLFVRASNNLAINMYKHKFGYSTYRRVLDYYSGEAPEDALDMRKALPRDTHKQSIIPLGRPVRPEELEW